MPDSYTFGRQPGDPPDDFNVQDRIARDKADAAKEAADAAKTEADKNKALIDAIKKELADGDHDITDDEIRRVVAAYLDENQFGESSQPIADFFPADLSTLSATGQFDANTLSRGAVPGAGVYALWRDTDGNNHEPARYLVITNGPSPQLWFGWKMGVVAPSWKQIGGLTEIADGSITKAKLSQEVQDELNAAAARVSKHLHASSYYYLRVAAGTQPPPLPAASEFTATVGANGAFTIAYAGALGITDARPANFESAYDYWSFQYQIIASSDSDPNPGVIITQGWQQIDVKDASAVDGITEARVREIVDAAVLAAGLNAAQTTAVQNLVNNSIASSGHQTEAEVNALIQTAIAGLITRDADQDGVILQNTLDIASLKTKTAANTASATGATARTRANMASIRALRNSVADGDITTVEASGGARGTGKLRIALTANHLNQNQYVLAIDGDDNLALLATRKLRAGNVDSIRIGEKQIGWRLSGRFFSCAALPLCPPNGLKRAELFTLTTPAQVKAFAETGGRDIEFDDLAEALQNRITAGAGSGLPNAQPLTKIDASGAGANAYIQLPPDYADKYHFALVNISEGNEWRRGILSVANDLSETSTSPLRASGTSDLRFTLATKRIANWSPSGNPDLRIINCELFAVSAVDVKDFADAGGRAIEYADLAEALQERIGAGGGAEIPADLLRLAHDLEIVQHPEGIWERPDNAVMAVNQPAAFLFTNESTTPNTINPEPFTKGGVAIASGSRTNFVRRHADPNSPDNAWPGITPYAAGQLDIAKAANEKNIILSCVMTQMAAQRAANNLEDETAIMLQFGDKKLMRFNQRGVDISIGQTAGGTAQTRAHFARYDSYTLPHINNTLHNNSIATIIAGHNIAALPRIKLTAKQYIADEQVPRRTSSVIVVPLANTAPTNFAIPIEGQQSIVGTLQYNAGNKGITYRFTSGHNVPGENFTIDFAVEISETINLPNGTVWGGALAAESLSHPEFFQRGYVNVLIIAFVKVHDEPDSPNNLMKMVYRINDFTHTTLLHQTRAQLKLDSNMVKLAATLQNAAKIQIGTYDSDHPPSEAELLAMDADTIGWGQIVRNHADDEVKIAADLGANKFSIINPDGSTRDFREAAPWAVAGSPLTVPKENLPVSAQVVSGILLPRVITVPHFTAQTADIDLGFKLDGEGGLRSQFEELVIPVEYKVGRNPAETGRANHRFHNQILRVALDALPAESSIIATGARWDRYIIIDAYPNTLQRIALHIWQKNQRQGNILNPISNIHINLVYQNNSNGIDYKAPLPAFGNVGHYDGLSVAAYHDPNARQVYLMPRNAAIQGEAGAGVAKGGAARTVLSKTDAADYATEWREAIENSANLLAAEISAVGTSANDGRAVNLANAKAIWVIWEYGAGNTNGFVQAINPAIAGRHIDFPCTWFNELGLRLENVGGTCRITGGLTSANAKIFMKSQFNSNIKIVGVYKTT